MREKYKKDIITIRKGLDKTTIKKYKPRPWETGIIADTIYFWKEVDKISFEWWCSEAMN